MNVLAAFLTALVISAPATVEGQRTAWHPLTLTFAGPQATETDNSPNPFLDIRLQVEFVGPNNQRYDVPGFFDGDGESSPAGSVWRARFTPDAAGTWHYTARFRRGSQVAIALEPDAGEAFTPAGLSEADLSGTFDVTPRDPDAPGYLKYGLLGYAGGHYLKFTDGPYWLRGGTDEPENLLAYEGFASTPPKHKYEDHASDWRDGDPDWGDATAVCGRGRAIIGMVNYLASQDVNSMYFLLMNVGGDGKDVWPWAGKINGKGSPENDNLHFDTLKLRQWNTVFTHAQRKGVMLHMVLNEAEEANKRELDGGELGPERKLFYREMIARFAHHPAVEWNLCEEYNLNFDYGPERMGAFANYLRAVDPYDHPIAAHTAGDPVEALRFIYGDPRYDMVSVQLNQRPIHEVTEAIWRETAKTGRPLPVSLDEFTLDRGQKASHIPVDDADGHRREKLWPTYFSGGQIEFILEGLLKVDTFRTPEREKLWRHMAIARHFMEDNLPFWEMQPTDGLVTEAGTIPLPIGKGKTQPLGPQVFTKPGEIYAVYLPTARPAGKLDLSLLAGPATLRWFNPRSGEFAGESREVAGGKPIALGHAPADPEQDWVVLVRRVTAKPAAAEQGNATNFPGEHWEACAPEQVGLASEPLDQLAAQLGGDGCVVRDGYLVRSWGNTERHKDWASAAKPVLSTLLLAAVADGKLASVDAHVKDVGWPLSEKDAAMTFRQLANMTSGYCCAEPPGAAWAYNDFAIQLYAKSLERVFHQPLDEAFRARLAALQLEDGQFFASREGLGVSASVRDFARLGWLWLNEGSWRGEQPLPRQLVRDSFQPGVPANLPRTAGRTDDYLTIGSYGGGTDQTPFGPGVYGFNFWFNTPGADGNRVWPALPADTFQANGMWNRDTVTVIPSLRMVVTVRGAKRDKFQPGDPTNDFNQALALVAKAARAPRAVAGSSPQPPSTRAFGSSAHHWRRIRDDKRFIQPLDDQPAYEASQVREIVDNILLFQRTNGGWPKDNDMLAVLTPEQRAAVEATRSRDDTSFDNSNGHSQVDYLARALPFVEDDGKVRAACLRGFDWLLAAQMPSGGFPQWYPRTRGYRGHITFNDGAMIGILNVLQDAAGGAEHWKWLDDDRRATARSAVERAIDCILKCQITAGGTRKGWCQQHDAATFAPTSARTFELASVCPQDTTQIVEFLERLANPSPEVLAAIESAKAWLARTALQNTRVVRVPATEETFLRHTAGFDTVVVREIGAPPIWARHYEIETDRPIFAGRDGVKRYALADIERERRTGTAWYGPWPQAVLSEVNRLSPGRANR